MNCKNCNNITTLSTRQFNIHTKRTQNSPVAFMQSSKFSFLQHFHFPLKSTVPLAIAETLKLQLVRLKKTWSLHDWVKSFLPDFSVLDMIHIEVIRLIFFYLDRPHFLFVRLHFILKNFKVRLSKKKIELGPKTYQLFVLPSK